jgi:hypothetical protein
MFKKSNEVFLEDIKKIHGDRYDYSKVAYNGNLEKIIIVCKKHGEFLQLPKVHLKGCGCTKCKSETISKKLSKTTDQFIKKANEVHGYKYDYQHSNFIGATKKLEILCKLHGKFIQIADSHLAGHGCKKCANEALIFSKSDTEEEFIKKAILVHNNRYNYNKVKYKGSKKGVIITCQEHGDFNQKPVHHIEGKGCIKCGQVSHYRRSDYIKKIKDKKVLFYTLRCFNGKEEFYKIGITSQSIKKRYNTNDRMPYMYEVVSEVYGNAEGIWDLELSEKRRLKEHNYQPLIKFAGSKTECFTKI